ncbi:MAG: hypothetical protein MUC87_11740 [Bacteroidia bacterium]|jgi:hypothetical protein|nr:hypothetical protein [Bacteroidia bacterium]
MFSSSQTQSDDIEVPEWASFFSGHEYLRFIKEVNNYFKAKNLQYTIGDGSIFVSENSFGFGKMGLLNLAQRCKNEHIDQYGAMIADHFELMARSHDSFDDFAKQANEFEKVRRDIGVRLYTEEYIAGIGKENTLGKDFAGNIYAMLVYDLPESVINVQPDALQKWGKTLDELFDEGIANMKARYPLTLSKETLEGVNIWITQADHFFTPNIAFDIHNHPQINGSHGTLVGLPGRHVALFYPIENLEVVKAVNMLISIVYNMHQRGPGSLSNFIFWYRDGEFTSLPYQIEENKIQFKPPVEFVNMLNGLGQ